MANTVLVGVDIGGTKCAVTLGIPERQGIKIMDKSRFPTTDVEGTIRDIKLALREILWTGYLQ